MVVDVVVGAVVVESVVVVSAAPATEPLSATVTTNTASPVPKVLRDRRPVP